MAALGDVFGVLNDLKRDGIVADYAVGGAMAVLFYAEPARTYDLDVFVLLPPQEGIILRMTPAYEYLQSRGFEPDAEHVRIYGVPVQLLPAYNPLVEEAVAQARTSEYEGIPVRVVGPEHLIALAMQTGGARRRERAAMLLEAGVADPRVLNDILRRNGLPPPEKAP